MPCLLRNLSGGQCIESYAAIANKDRMFMFCGGSFNCAHRQIECTASADGRFFEKIFTEHFSCGKAGEWNSSELGRLYVFRAMTAERIYFITAYPIFERRAIFQRLKQLLMKIIFHA